MFVIASKILLLKRFVPVPTWVSNAINQRRIGRPPEETGRTVVTTVSGRGNCPVENAGSAQRGVPQAVALCRFLTRSSACTRERSIRLHISSISARLALMAGATANQVGSIRIINPFSSADRFKALPNSG